MTTRSKVGIFKPKALAATVSKPKFAVEATIDYTLTEPPSFKIAAQYPQWCSAMDEEFDALKRQNTWSLVPASPSQNVVGCKWVFKLKHNSDGNISRYKARLVAKGFHQQYGVDFEETFSPIIKPPTVRIILSLVVQFNWPLRQLDVRNAFLHGFLREKVYMVQPFGYVDPDFPNHVCKLWKSLYDLKQAPWAWFDRFSTQLLHMGFEASLANSSLFILKQGKVLVYLLVYVDDIVLTGNHPDFLTSLIKQLSQAFELKDLGPFHYFLGLHITRTSKGLFLSQTLYAHDLLVKHNILSSNLLDLLVLPLSDWSLMRVLYFLIPMSIEAWLVPFIT